MLEWYEEAMTLVFGYPDELEPLQNFAFYIYLFSNIPLIMTIVKQTLCAGK